MSNYPITTYGIDSEITPEAGIEDDIAQTGTQHSRLFYTGFYNFQLIHHLTYNEYKTLKAFYDANYRTAITLTYLDVSPTVTYTVKFTSEPKIAENYGLSRFRVDVTLRGYKN